MGSKKIILMVLIAVALLATGVLVNSKLNDEKIAKVQDSLLKTLQSNESKIEEYILGTAKIAESLSKAKPFQRYVYLLSEPDTAENSRLLEQSKREVSDLLLSVQEESWGKYHHIFVVNGSKKITISPNHGLKSKGSPSGHVGEDTSKNVWLQKAFYNNETTVSDYTSWVESDHNHQMLFYPVQGSNKIVAAVIGFELQIPYQIKLATENFSFGKNGKIFFTAVDGTIISYKGNGNKIKSSGINEALESGISKQTRINSKGIEVINVLLKNSEYPWILIAEIEKKQALKGI